MTSPAGRQRSDYTVTLFFFAGLVVIAHLFFTAIEVFGVNTSCTDKYNCISSTCGPCSHITYAAWGSTIAITIIATATVVLTARRTLPARTAATTAIALIAVAVSLHITALAIMSNY